MNLQTGTLLCTLLLSINAMAVAASDEKPPEKETHPLSALSIWDDGLAEMSYYRAVDQIYGKPRAYTRVVLVNRQWMDPDRGVKTELTEPDAVAVFKLNIAEEIPTENYNYRYLTTVFLERPALATFKIVVSSQEWCGATFKHLRRHEDGLRLQSFSYFPGEGDKQFLVEAGAVPYEALLLIARDVAATGESRKLNVIAPLRSTHEVEPAVLSGTLIPSEALSITVDAGTFRGRRVDMDWKGQRTAFVVKTEPPYNLLRYQMGRAKGDLQFVERRGYWDRSWKSEFHAPNKAP